MAAGARDGDNLRRWARGVAIGTVGTRAADQGGSFQTPPIDAESRRGRQPERWRTLLPQGVARVTYPVTAGLTSARRPLAAVSRAIRPSTLPLCLHHNKGWGAWTAILGEWLTPERARRAESAELESHTWRCGFLGWARGGTTSKGRWRAARAPHRQTDCG
eukprot:scaffold7296_cov100-Isochrysis_galbana.AAC.7